MRSGKKFAGCFAVVAALAVTSAGYLDAVALARAAPAPALSRVATATRVFEYDGNPVHPRLVECFSGWLSDVAPPVVVAVDVSAAAEARNEYNRQAVRVDERGVWYAKSPKEHFGYKYVGSMTNGICVLLTWEWGGGSKVFADLLLVGFQEHPRNRHLLLYVVARRSLGDRGVEHVTVRPGRVEVSAAKTKNGEWSRLVIRASEYDGLPLDL